MTTVPVIYAFAEQQLVAEAVADFVRAAQDRSLAKAGAHHTRFAVALSGGSLLQVLAQGLLPVAGIKWSQWDIYFADERLVPQSSPESNSGQAQRVLFDHLPLDNRPTVHCIDYSLLADPQECADAYEQTLITGFASKDSVRLPQFDLVLLGCAPDGHVASLFPASPTLREEYAWVIPVTEAPHGPSERVTLSLPVLCHAKKVAFVSEGKVKAKVICDIMDRPDKGLPGSIINERCAGKVVWFVDQEAVQDVLGVTKKRYKFTYPADGA